jgi:DNA-directed RNA polymerase subunit RPC12/RpoP
LHKKAPKSKIKISIKAMRNANHPISMKVYKCAMCGEEFQTDVTDEEAMAECAENFGETDINATDVVCDDCYQAITIGGKPVIMN